MTSTKGYCNVCRQLFDTSKPGTWLEITGFVEVRRTQGTSANAVHEKRYTGRVVCPTCAKEHKLGVLPGQTSLFA